MSKDITHIDREINKKRINTFDKKKYYFKEYHTTTDGIGSSHTTMSVTGGNYRVSKKKEVF